MKKVYLSIILILAILLSIATSVRATGISDIQTALESQENITVSQAITVGAGTNETLDLKGKTITVEETITISDGGSLTVTGNGKIKTSTLSQIFKVENGGSLIIENGEIENTKTGVKAIWVIGTQTDSGVKTKVDIKKDAIIRADCPISIGLKADAASYGVEVDVSGKLLATIESQEAKYGTSGISINGKIKKTTGNVPLININEGAQIETLEGTTGNANGDASAAIYAAGFAKINIKGGKLSGTDGLSIKSGIINITGGTIEATGAYVNPVQAWNNGSETTGAAIGITSNSGYAGNIELTISDATIISKNGYGIIEILTSAQTTSVKSFKINSAEIIAPQGTVYTQSQLEYLAENCVEKEIEENTYVIGIENTISIFAEQTGGTVTSDLAKALPGEKVKLIVTPHDGYEFETLEVIDSKTRKVITTDDEFVMAGGNVEVKAIFTKVAVKTELPTIDENKEINVLVKDEEKIEEVLMDSLKADTALAQIAENDNIRVEVQVSDVQPTEELKNKVSEVLAEKSDKIKIAKFFDITLAIKDDSDSVLGELTQLTEPIKLSVVLPTDLPKLESGYERIYYVVRTHEGVTQILEATLAEDGKTLEFVSDKFSEYSLAYVDQESTAKARSIEESTTNPQTGDKVMIYIAILIISIVGIIITGNKISKKNKKH